MERKIKAGSRVRLSLACTNTIKNYGLNELMRKLFGSIQIVTEVCNNTVRIEDWDWHINDLILIDENKPRKKIKIQHFDPEYLDV